MTSAPAIPTVPARDLRTAAYLLLLVPVPVACLMAMLLGVAPLLATLLLAGGLAVSCTVARVTAANDLPLVRMFFVVAACHAAIGYLIAGPTSRLIWIGTSAAEDYAHAFVVISAGLFSATVAYAIVATRRQPRFIGFCRKWQFNDARLLAFARILVVPGIAAIVFVYARIGLVPLLADSPGRARYINYQVSDDFLVYEWIVSRALDLLTFSLPLIIGSAVWNRKWLDRLLALAGAAAFLVPLRRANMLSVVIVLVLMHWLKTGRTQLKHVAIVLVLAAVYAASQLVFINLWLADFESDTAFAVAGSALPEVRDLGWTIDLMDGDRLNGTTFLQALVPLPSLVSDFSQTHSLRAVTSRLIGLDAERRTGGLRLTLAGEAYLNFGYFGPVLVGALFGMVCAYLEAVIDELKKRRTTWANYTAAVLFVWICFWVYLGGTQAAATIKIGSVLLIGALFLARMPPVARRQEV